MAQGVVGGLNKWGREKESTWTAGTGPTAVAVGAGDQVEVLTPNIPPAVGYEPVESQMGGLGPLTTVQGPLNFPFNPEVRPHYWGQGLEWAASLGECNDATQEGATTAWYKNYRLTETIGDHNFTWAVGKQYPTTSGVIATRELAGTTYTGWTLSCAAGEHAKLAMKAVSWNLEPNSATNTTTQTDALTMVDAALSDALHFNHSATWLNAQSGGALSSSDAICLKSFSIDFDNGAGSAITNCGYGKINQPSRYKLPKVEVTLDFEKNDDAAHFKRVYNGTEAKMVFRFTGAQLAGVGFYNYLYFYLPRLIGTGLDDSVNTNEQGSHVLKMKALVPSTAPTGMADTDDDIADDITQLIRVVECSQLAADPLA